MTKEVEVNLNGKNEQIEKQVSDLFDNDLNKLVTDTKSMIDDVQKVANDYQHFYETLNDAQKQIVIDNDNIKNQLKLINTGFGFHVLTKCQYNDGIYSWNETNNYYKVCIN